MIGMIDFNSIEIIDFDRDDDWILVNDPETRVLTIEEKEDLDGFLEVHPELILNNESFCFVFTYNYKTFVISSDNGGLSDECWPRVGYLSSLM